jgi:hypothetical protein
MAEPLLSNIELPQSSQSATAGDLAASHGAPQASFSRLNALLQLAKQKTAKRSHDDTITPLPSFNEVSHSVLATNNRNAFNQLTGITATPSVAATLATNNGFFHRLQLSCNRFPLPLAEEPAPKRSKRRDTPTHEQPSALQPSPSSKTATRASRRPRRARQPIRKRRVCTPPPPPDSDRRPSLLFEDAASGSGTSRPIPCTGPNSPSPPSSGMPTLPLFAQLRHGNSALDDQAGDVTL